MQRIMDFGNIDGEVRLVVSEAEKHRRDVDIQCVDGLARQPLQVQCLSGADQRIQLPQRQKPAVVLAGGRSEPVRIPALCIAAVQRVASKHVRHGH